MRHQVCTGEKSSKRRKLYREIPRAEFEKATPSSYAQQLSDKKAVVEQLFSDLSIPDIEVHESEIEHHRMR